MALACSSDAGTGRNDEYKGCANACAADWECVDGCYANHPTNRPLQAAYEGCLAGACKQARVRSPLTRSETSGMLAAMSTRLAARTGTIAPSSTLAMSAKAAELRGKGHDVIAFGVGEPDFEPPAVVLEGAKAAIDRGVSKYTAVSGTIALKQAIQNATEAKRGYVPRLAEIIVSVGAKHTLFNLALALYEPGDEVIIPAPYWVSYPEQVRLFGATPVIVDTTEASSFRLTPAQLEAAITPKTKALVLCTPSNPTGSAYDAESLTALAEVVKRHDIWVLVDEIYADLVYGGFKHVSLRAIAPELAERLVVIDGVSKSHAMTGWRIGWCVAPAPLAKVLDTIQSQSTTNPAAISQEAARIALESPVDTTMRDRFEARRNRMMAGLRTIPGMTCRMPEGAFYAFPDVRAFLGKKAGIDTDVQLALHLLNDAHVATVPGSSFGAPGYLRLSYATSEERIDEGVARLKRACAALAG